MSGFAEPDYGATPETRDDLIISSSAPYTLHTYAPWGIIWYDAETETSIPGISSARAVIMR